MTVTHQATSTLVTRQSHAKQPLPRSHDSHMPSNLYPGHTTHTKQPLPWSHNSHTPSNLYPGHTTVPCQATLYPGHMTVTHHLTPPRVLAVLLLLSAVRSAVRARTPALVLVGRSTARDPPVLQTACVGHLAVPVCVGVCVCGCMRVS